MLIKTKHRTRILCTCSKRSTINSYARTEYTPPNDHNACLDDGQLDPLALLDNNRIDAWSGKVVFLYDAGTL